MPPTTPKPRKKPCSCARNVMSECCRHAIRSVDSILYWNTSTGVLHPNTSLVKSGRAGRALGALARELFRDKTQESYVYRTDHSSTLDTCPLHRCICCAGRLRCIGRILWWLRCRCLCFLVGSHGSCAWITNLARHAAHDKESREATQEHSS